LQFCRIGNFPEPSEFLNTRQLISHFDFPPGIRSAADRHPLDQLRNDTLSPEESSLCPLENDSNTLPVYKPNKNMEKAEFEM
jgi:hypothetical protein